MDEWEYQIFDLKAVRETKFIDWDFAEQELNTLGGQGWELAGVTNNVMTRNGNVETVVTLIFKRRKP
jgi:Domain of unknown function (DUF4177)